LAGLNLLDNQQVDLVILDVGLPDISGFEVCKSIRKFSDVPIIFLTARGEEIDRVVGLEIGGDDYVVKPFSPRELVARVKVILKRQVSNHSLHTVSPPFKASITTTSNKPIQAKSIALGQSFTLNEEKRRIEFCQVELELTTYEYGILVLLLTYPERVFTREQLMNAVWSTPEESFDRAVDTHIKTIRAKLRTIDAKNSSLTTHRGVGYSIKLS
jgi:two-component system catabolic regulation response regulator CreB